MPYCNITFFAPDRDEVLTMLSNFARENFVGGRSAYEIAHNRFSIDAGENDIRAVYDEETRQIKFFCRYIDDLSRYEKKLHKFATTHMIATQGLK